MSKEEYFKLHYGGDRIQGSGQKYIEEWLQCSIVSYLFFYFSGAIIRHHNPAFDGIVNAGFGGDSPGKYLNDLFHEKC